jgi:peptidoglycan/xylan/chitin deacetylase (PgdA/CDA1 family)
MAPALAIMYHDVVEGEAWDSSGFPGAAAASYKLTRKDFARHLDAILRAAPGIRTPLAESGDLAPGVLLTFDDGGTSVHEPIGEMLEDRGWRGHFFITTDRIGTAGFVSKEQIRDLRRRGHVIGSHSCSHPTRMSQLTEPQLRHEWMESKRILEEILSEPVLVASVPGGYYSKLVGATADQAGIRTLFHSEPTSVVGLQGGCRLIGRYVVRRDMAPEISASIATGRLGPRLRQSLQWKIKKAAKCLAGDLYLKGRLAVLGK